MENKFYIIGCGGHARSVADVVLHNNELTEIVFVDEAAKNDEEIFGFKVIKQLPDDAENIFVAIGDNGKREAFSKQRNLATVISKTAYIGKNALIEDGCFIAAGAHIGPEAHIGRGCIINTNAVVEHEVEVGKFSHIAPNTTVCGRTKIGKNCFIGAGAAVKDKILICADVIVGAGGVVVKDILESGTYVGCPIRKSK